MVKFFPVYLNISMSKKH